jgi:hypothetical protein
LSKDAINAVVYEHAAGMGGQRDASTVPEISRGLAT